MIFLVFGTSVALLEAELAPFKDWEDIGNICSSSCHRERLLSNSRVASLKQIVIIIIDRESRGIFKNLNFFLIFELGLQKG